MEQQPNFNLDEKSCLFYAEDNGNLHISWEIEHGRVLAFENVPCNSPAICILSFSSVKEYLETILGVAWIVDENNFVKGEPIKEIIKLSNRILIPENSHYCPICGGTNLESPQYVKVNGGIIEEWDESAFVTCAECGIIEPAFTPVELLAEFCDGKIL